MSVTGAASNAHDESFVAASDFSSAQFYICKINTTADQVALCTSATGGTARAAGIVQNTPSTGKAATVRLIANGGISQVVSSAAIAVGDLIACTTAGTAVTAATTGQYVIGQALSASTASSQVITIALGPSYIIMGSTA